MNFHRDEEKRRKKECDGEKTAETGGKGKRIKCTRSQCVLLFELTGRW